MVKIVNFVVSCVEHHRPRRGYDAYPSGLNYPKAIQPMLWATARDIGRKANIVRFAR